MIYDTPEQKNKRRLIRKAIFVEIFLLMVAGALIFIWLMPYEDLYRMFGVEEKPEIKPAPPAPVVTRKIPQPAEKSVAQLPKPPEAVPELLPPPPPKKVIPAPSLLYTVQVGAFRQMNRAELFSHEIKKLGYDIYIYQTPDTKGRIWNLVRIGDFSNFETAQKARNGYKARHRRDAVITFVNSWNPVKRGDVPEQHAHVATTASFSQESQEESEDTAPKAKTSNESASPNRFSVQAGAFISAENAENLSEFLQSKGYNAYIREFADAKGRVWNLVRIGDFADYPTAKEAAGQYKQKENMPAVITQMDSMAVVPEN